MQMYVDTHLHLSGSTPIEVLWRLVQDSGFKTPIKDYWEFQKTLLMDKNNVHDLDSYLKILHWIDKVQSSPYAIEKSVYNSYVSSYLSGCSYLELRMNPTKRSQDGTIDLDKIIMAARAGKEKAKSLFGIRGDLTLCMGRDCTPKANVAVFDKAIKYFDKGVVGIDIAGPYTGNWQNQMGFFEEAYKAAHQKGLITTVHCGEEKHNHIQEEMHWVVNKLRPKRIGHGIQMVLMGYHQLLHEASKQGIEFEICISSNLATQVVKDLQEFKTIFRTLESFNIKYSINTDATHLLQTNIKRENELYEQIKNLP